MHPSQYPGAAWQAPVPPPPPPRRRGSPWLVIGLIGGAALVVLVVSVTVFVLVVKPFGANDVPAVHYSGQAGLPGQQLLASMRKQPTDGWRVDLKALLPGSTAPKAESYVGTAGSAGYFVVVDYARAGLPGTWLLGVDVDAGTPTFPPVELSAGGEATCYLNGPSHALCLQSVIEDSTPDMTYDAYVIDTTTGRVLVETPTQLTPYDSAAPHFAVRQVGDFAVALQDATGARGIGHQGELTWSVTGTSAMLSEVEHAPGDPPANVAVLVTDGKDRAFSAVDGTELLESDRIDPYVGGFITRGTGDDVGFDFYDEHGAKVGRYEPPGRHIGILTGTSQLPAVSLGDTTQVVFDPRGVPMAVLDTTTLRHSRIIGSSIFVDKTDDPGEPAGSTEWDEFDLKTGSKIATCRGLPLADRAFVGSDGTVVVGSFGEPNEPHILVAVDTDTCANVWQLDAVADAWAVGSTLVQSRPDRSELVSLVSS